MAKNDNLTDFLTDVASAIRAKKRSTALINPQNFSSEINAIDISYFLDKLTNPADEDDIYVGKEAYTDKGELLVGKGKGSGKYCVKVIDYDGTVLREKRGNTGDVIKLPTPPTHDRLVFQTWSATVNVVNNTVTIANGDIIVGAVYTTASGLSEFDITLTSSTDLNVTLNMAGAKNWGDGTSNSDTSHTYSKAGNYTITCDGTSISGYLFGQSLLSRNYYATGARLGGNVTTISLDVFNYCYSFASITIPQSVTTLGGYAFAYCYSLKAIVIPKSITTIGTYAFSYCYALTDIVIPNDVLAISSYAFRYCYSLAKIIIPQSVTSIGSYAFADCLSLVRYDFANSTSIPTLSSRYTFSNINEICKIIVPDNLYSSWKSASYWSNVDDYIYKASEV